MEDIRDTDPVKNEPTEGSHYPNEVDLYSYYRVIKKRWKLVLFVFFATTVAAAIVSLLMTKIYRAETTIFPIQSSSSGRIASMVDSSPI